ncbi:MAG: gliding motility-associated C-terminal domain-containing protein, partial [Bacteroidota bacterium]
SDVKTSTAWLTPVADFEPNKYTTTVAKPTFSFYNHSKPDSNNTYWWDFSVDPLTGLPRTSTDINPTDKAFASDTGKIAIKLRVTSVKGCIDSVTKYVEIEPDITVFIPNVFWPKTDGKGGSNVDCQGGNPVSGIPCNSQFYVQARGFETIEIYVYNRWGKLVFQTKDIKQGWNGIDQKTGGECQQDAYVYQIFATSFAGKKYQYSGSLTLMR